MTIFGLKMMMKSGLEKIILKFHVHLQSCCSPMQKNLPRKAELAWLLSRYLWRGTWNFKITFSRPLFTIIFKPKMVISRVKILVTYSSRSRWCAVVEMLATSFFLYLTLLPLCISLLFSFTRTGIITVSLVLLRVVLCNLICGNQTKFIWGFQWTPTYPVCTFSVFSFSFDSIL